MILFIQTILLFLIFIILFFLTFYCLGFLLISKVQKDLEKPEIISLSICLGFTIFTLLSGALGILSLRILLLPLIICLTTFTLVKNRLKVLLPWQVFIENKLLFVMIILGILIQGPINFPSGYLFGHDLLFWSSQGHDGLWHVATIEAIKKSLPPENPGFAGERLYNYHYLVDVIMGEFARIFPFFSSLDLYFRFFPVIFSLFMNLAIFSFATRWQNNKKVGFLAVFFVTLTGSFGFIVNLIHGNGIFGGETAFWAAQANTIIGNPPHAISHGILPCFLLSFLIFLKKKDKLWFLITFLSAGLLAGFKVSGGLVMLVGLGFATLIDLLFYRKGHILGLTAALGLSNLVTFKLLTSSSAPSFLMFLPWWFIRTTIVDKLGWIDLENQRQHYLSKGSWHAYLRVIQLEIEAFFIFLIGNSGARVIGFYAIVKKLFSAKFYKDPFEGMLFMMMLTGFLVPLFFVQKGLIYNNIQFMQYFLMILAFYAAYSTEEILKLFKKTLYKIVIFSLIAIVAIPTVVGSLNEFYGPGKNPLAKITEPEQMALKYLKENSQPNDVILTMPFNQYLKNNYHHQPWPIYAWYNTPYVSAISARPSYLASEHVTLLGYPTLEDRQKNQSKFFEKKDYVWNKQFLNEFKIKFIYLPKFEFVDLIQAKGKEDQLFTEFAAKNNLSKFFENNEVIIYKVI